MTSNDFRKMALGFPGTVESAHMNHPDFRAEERIFATLGYPDESWGMVGLTGEQQRVLIRRGKGAFRPCNGVWGERGATNVHLGSAEKSLSHFAPPFVTRSPKQKNEPRENRAVNRMVA